MSHFASPALLVVSPRLCLVVAAVVLVLELSLALIAPWLRLLLTTTSAQRSALRQHRARIAALRREVAHLNSPATFVEHSRAQRALDREVKLQQQLHASLGLPIPGAPMGGMGLAASAAASGGKSLLNAAQDFALSYGMRMLAYFSLYIAGRGTILYVLPAEGWLAPLWYTPMRLLLGEVGITPWLAVCGATASAIKAWL